VRSGFSETSRPITTEEKMFWVPDLVLDQLMLRNTIVVSRRWSSHHYRTTFYADRFNRFKSLVNR
jgi:hypothetical protein